ncbi:MAG: tetraacyldisaccharide 4'-kinase [Gemmatimonadota bacterium]
MSALDALWYGKGLASVGARSLLSPASLLYRAGVALRNRRYDSSSRAVSRTAVPALSIGNITVGGTGKTPVAAWAASQLAVRGAHPAIVMRGYGHDEPLVHRTLNPDVPVIVDADRVAGAETARVGGADCVILDDAFQHRRAARVSDWVLVSCERWRDGLRLLPAGPLREPLESLSRAHVIVVTRKSDSADEAKRVAERLAKRFPRADVAVTLLSLHELVDARTHTRMPLVWMEGRRLAAAAAVGAPDAFFAQLRATGAQLDPHAFPDHHAFTDADVRKLVAAADAREGLVCTLKDAVKLAGRWPAAAATLWYVSQNVVIEHGAAVLDRALDTVLAAREDVSSTAG